MEAFGGFAKSYLSELWGSIPLEVTYTGMRSDETATRAIYFKNFCCEIEPRYVADMHFKYDIYCKISVCQ